MKLSTKGRYGVKAMFDLALYYGKEPVSIKIIAERENISECYLEQLFSPLRKNNLVTSVRGAQGGYVLSRTPKEITVAEIIDAVEGPIEFSECLNDNSCDNLECCATRSLWIKIKESIDNVTNSVTLEDMVNDYNQMLKKRSE